MADSDYDRGDRRDDDDRSRHRRDDDAPKKKSPVMMILLIVGGLLLLLCVLPCGVGIWWVNDIAQKMTGTAETFLAKVGSGDYSGAYNSTTPAFKSKKTLDQFTADMKAAKLDTYQAKSFKPTSSNSVGTHHTLGGTAQTSGGAVNITVTIEQGGNGFDFTVDDVTGPGIGTGLPSTPPTGK